MEMLNFPDLFSSSFWKVFLVQIRLEVSWLSYEETACDLWLQDCCLHTKKEKHQYCISSGVGPWKSVILRNELISANSFIFKNNELWNFITSILRQKVNTWMARDSSWGKRIRRKGKQEKTMPENGIETWKEKWGMREKLCFSKFKNLHKDFNNESRGRKELKYDTNIMKDKLSDERNLELKIKIKFSLFILCISLKFRALLWWTRMLTIGMQIELV